MNKPVLSIVIANYNYGKFLEEAIKSVISQGMGGQVELIICDAGSADDSVEIIKKYANGLPPNTAYHSWRCNADSQTNDSHSQLITWWCSEKDGGQSAAFNKGFRHSRGRFLTWLNADDMFAPNALRTFASYVERFPNNEWFTGSMMRIDQNGVVFRCSCAHKFSRLRALLGAVSVSSPSSFFTRSLYEEVGGLDESLHYVMDIDLWNRFYFMARTTFVRMRESMFLYRVHASSKTSGADVSDSSVARENRKAFRNEANLLDQRYPGFRNRYLRYTVLVITSSIVDRVYGWLMTKSHEGRRCYDA